MLFFKQLSHCWIFMSVYIGDKYENHFKMMQRHSYGNDFALMNGTISIVKFPGTFTASSQNILQQKKAGRERESPNTVAPSVNKALKTIMTKICFVKTSNLRRHKNENEWNWKAPHAVENLIPVLLGALQSYIAQGKDFQRHRRTNRYPIPVKSYFYCFK